MAEKETPSLGGFDLLSNMLTGGNMSDTDGRKSVDDPPIVDPEQIKAELDKDPDEEEKKDEKNTVVPDKDPVVDPAESSDDSVDSSSDTGKDTKSDSSSDVSDGDLGEYESDITELLNERFSEELGWEIPEDSKPKTVKEFVELMKGVVEESSTPQYASDEIKAFDEYVKQGGSLRDFYKTTVEGRIDVDTANTESSYDQKRILSEHLVNQGYGEERITKMIKRYEDAGVLEEEAEDALELLKSYNQKVKGELLENQEKTAKLAQEQQQKFVESVKDNIKSLDNILGYTLSDKDKKDLENSILTVDAEGYTPYQRKYMSDIKELLSSAFITMKGDALQSKINTKSKSDAVKNLHDKLKANKGNNARQSGNSENGKTSSGLSVLGSMLQGNNNF